MKARILGEPILDFHAVLVGLSLLDGFLVLWNHRIAWLHVPSVLWSSLVNTSSWVCPLTPLENMFRHLAGQAGYQGTFIQHYIAPLVSPGWMPRRQEGAVMPTYISLQLKLSRGYAVPNTSLAAR